MRISKKVIRYAFENTTGNYYASPKMVEILRVAGTADYTVYVNRQPWFEIVTQMEAQAIAYCLEHNTLPAWLEAKIDAK